MDEMSALPPVVSSITQAIWQLYKHGAESAASEKQIARLKQCILGALTRELVFNKEVICELQRRKSGDVFPVWTGEGRARLVRAIRTDTFVSLEAGVLPLEEILDGRQLTEGAHDEFFCPPGKKTPRRYANHAKYINSQSELLTRTYHRLHMFMVIWRRG
jgi:hypothetical protein